MDRIRLVNDKLSEVVIDLVVLVRRVDCQLLLQCMYVVLAGLGIGAEA